MVLFVVILLQASRRVYSHISSHIFSSHLISDASRPGAQYRRPSLIPQRRMRHTGVSIQFTGQEADEIGIYYGRGAYVEETACTYRYVQEMNTH